LEFEGNPDQKLISATAGYLMQAGETEDPDLEERLAANEASLLLEIKKAVKKVTVEKVTVEKEGSASLGDPVLPVQDIKMVSSLTKVTNDISEWSNQTTLREVKLLELKAELKTAQKLQELGFTYEALHHFQRCLDKSAILFRLDAEVAAPIETQFLAGISMAAIYRDEGEHAKRQTSLERAYDGLLETRHRGLTTKHYISEDPEFFKHIAEAVIYHFYIANGSSSALEENAFYSDEITYFGKMVNRRFTLTEQQDDRVEHPYRIFKVKEIRNLTGNEKEGFLARVVIEYWLADSKKANTIKINTPGNKRVHEIKLAFDDLNRLKIFHIKNFEPKQDKQ